MRNIIFLKQHLLMSLSPQTCSSVLLVRPSQNIYAQLMHFIREGLVYNHICRFAYITAIRRGYCLFFFFLLNAFPQNLHACLLSYAGSKNIDGSLIEPFDEWLLFALLKLFHIKLDAYILDFKWELQCIYSKIRL